MLQQILLDLALHRNPNVARLFRPIKSGFARLHDGTVRYLLNGHVLRLPLSHDLPAARYLLPAFSDNLRRLAAFIRERDGTLCMIDVGANVGDSWALAAGGAQDTFLLVEGCARFFRFLQRNTAGIPGLTLVHCLLSDREADVAARIAVGRGNARVVEGDAGAGYLHYRSLDGLLETHPTFRSASLLKVDVEGFDARVLRGARQLLASARPTVLFEHQPYHIVRRGEDDRAVFDELASAGYRHFVLYDNRGYLVGEVSVNEPWLDTFLDYARQQFDYFFDVCCFHDTRHDAREAFLARERRWATMLRGAAPEPIPST